MLYLSGSSEPVLLSFFNRVLHVLAYCASSDHLGKGGIIDVLGVNKFNEKSKGGQHLVVSAKKRGGDFLWALGLFFDWLGEAFMKQVELEKGPGTVTFSKFQPSIT